MGRLRVLWLFLWWLLLLGLLWNGVFEGLGINVIGVDMRSVDSLCGVVVRVRGMSHPFMSEVLKALRMGIKFTGHAFQVMYSAERMVTVDEVLEALRVGDVVEDYVDDPRGHSCLILGFTKGRRPVHVVCAPKDEFLVVITAYEPSLNKWMPDFKARRMT